MRNPKYLFHVTTEKSYRNILSSEKFTNQKGLACCVDLYMSTGYAFRRANFEDEPIIIIADPELNNFVRNNDAPNLYHIQNNLNPNGHIAVKLNILRNGKIEDRQFIEIRNALDLAESFDDITKTIPSLIR